MGIWQGLTENVAATEPDHPDARLRGRTYAVPFEDVWRAAIALASGGLKRWSIAATDDQEGVIEAEAGALIGGKVDDVIIRVYLDENAQTRVDARSAARTGRGDYGRNARRLRRFFRELDQAVVGAQDRRRGPGRAAGPTFPQTSST